MINKFKYPFYVIGLDIGGTKIAGGILYYTSPEIKPDIIYKEQTASLAKQGRDVFLKSICDFVDVLIDKAKALDSNVDVIAVGIGTANRVHKTTGVVKTETDNFPGYAGVKLCETVTLHCGLPVYALNDVQAHTLGELRWGAGIGSSDFILLAVGTGVGGAVVVDSKLLKGSHGYAGELGHIQVSYGSDIDCPCGKTGHLEGASSGSGIERNYEKLTGKKLSGAEISALAANGDKDAVKVIELSGRVLGRSIATLQSVFDPQKFILSGSVINAGMVWRNALFAGYNEEVVPPLDENLVIESAILGDDAAIYGACENALDGLKS